MAKEKAKSLVDVMKERISNSGKSKGSIFYVKKDGKIRVRFLQDMEEGMMVTFHDKWKEFNHPCLSYYGKECPNCKNSEARTSENYIWSVYNYETKQVELFIYKANKCSPIPSLISMYESYGTICDRDYVIQKHGEGTDTNYSVVPMDKKAFKGEHEAFEKKKVYAMLLKAFPCEDLDADDVDDDEEEPPKKAKKSAKKPEPEPEEDDEEEDEDDEDEEDEEEEEKPKSSKKAKVPVDEDEDDDETPDFNSMSPVELKKAAKKYGIKITEGMKKSKLVALLEDAYLPF